MRKMIFGLFMILCAVPVFAGTYHLGVAAYGGYDYPVIQDDVGPGFMWSAGLRGNIWKFVHGEVVFRGSQQGDKDQDLDFGNGQVETITFKGGDLSGFGINLLFAHKDPVSVWPYASIGWSSNKFKPGYTSGKGEQTLTGWGYGGGIGFNLYQKQIYLDLGASLLLMTIPDTDNKATRKNGQVRAGIQYFIPIKTKSN